MKTADPVASQSGFLCTYMNGHKDTLHAYVLAHTDAQAACSCKMDAIDAEGFTLSYLAASNPDTKLPRQTVRIPFTPKIKSYDELRPRMLEMKREAEAASGMHACPVINSAPALTLRVLAGLAITAAVALLSFVEVVPPPHAHIPLTILIGVHIIEASFLFTRLRKYKVPFPTNVCYYCSILLFSLFLSAHAIVVTAHVVSS